MAKQRPHASPAPRPGDEPNVNWFTAAVNPLAAFPQAGQKIEGSELCVVVVQSGEKTYQVDHIRNSM